MLWLCGPGANYGHALKLFHSTWLGSITRRTTVIVIGDGRTNYNPPNAWILGEIKRKCRRLVWLCPEEQHSCARWKSSKERSRTGTSKTPSSSSQNSPETGSRATFLRHRATPAGNQATSSTQKQKTESSL